MERLVLEILFALFGILFVCWGIWRLRQPMRAEDLEWAEQHPFLNRLLGDSSLRRHPIHFEKAGAQSCVFSGSLSLVFAVVLVVV